jgi:AcrR family transcriptional regulator
MDTTPVVDTDRRAALVEIAADTFIRFGFRKTSMDEVARAARMSRQGLYFHFPNKEALFREVVQHLATGALSALKAELARTKRGLEERLYGAFMAMDSNVFGEHDSTYVQEIFASAAELCPEIVRDLDVQIVTAVTRALSGARRRALPAKTLAEHLYAASYGFKHRGLSRQEYASRMKAAVRIVCAARTSHEPT